MNDSGNNIEVSIVMPCLNEAKTIGDCVKNAKQALNKLHVIGEIIVADNGSIDGSGQIASDLGAHVVHVDEKGYGAALIGGISAANGKYVIMGDSDGTYDFEGIEPFISKLRQGFDLVMGCRFPSGGGEIMPGAMPWKSRWFGVPLLNFIGRLFFHTKVRDFHCGLRGFSLAAYELMDLHSTGMEFASEMIVKAALLKMKVTEIPITLHKNQYRRIPHLRPWRDGWRHLRFMLLFSPKWLFLIPGIIMFLCGLLLGGILLPGPLRIGHIGFDTNTLLICAMVMLIGYQLITFALFTKVFAISEGFLPSNKNYERIFKTIKLETGLLTGLSIMFAGAAILLGALWYWRLSKFGQLSYPVSLRIVIPGVTILMLGIQTIFASFFLSILGLKRK